MIHGFFWMAGALDRGKELIAEMGNELRSTTRGSMISEALRPQDCLRA